MHPSTSPSLIQHLPTKISKEKRENARCILKFSPLTLTSSSLHCILIENQNATWMHDVLERQNAVHSSPSSDQLVLVRWFSGNLVFLRIFSMSYPNPSFSSKSITVRLASTFLQSKGTFTWHIHPTNKLLDEQICSKNRVISQMEHLAMS